MIKSFKMLALTLMISLGGGTSMATEDFVVETQLICVYEAAAEMFVAFQKSDGELKEGCVALPYQIIIKILRIEAGPVKDFEGDDMYLVYVGKNIYTLAWPSLNSNVPPLKTIR